MAWLPFFSLHPLVAVLEAGLEVGHWAELKSGLVLMAGLATGLVAGAVVGFLEPLQVNLSLELYRLDCIRSLVEVGCK